MVLYSFGIVGIKHLFERLERTTWLDTVLDALLRNGYKHDQFLYVPELVLRTITRAADSELKRLQGLRQALVEKNLQI